MKWLWGIMAVLTLLLQARLWAGENSLPHVWALQEQIQEQKAINAGLSHRNEELFAEVNSLGDGTRAIEEQARGNLGMIGEDETFFLVEEP